MFCNCNYSRKGSRCRSTSGGRYDPGCSHNCHCGFHCLVTILQPSQVVLAAAVAAQKLKSVPKRKLCHGRCHMATHLDAAARTGPENLGCKGTQQAPQAAEGCGCAVVTDSGTTGASPPPLLLLLEPSFVASVLSLCFSLGSTENGLPPALTNCL